MRKITGMVLPDVRPVYMRLPREMVTWLDQEARKQRRSRAYVVGQSVRMMRAVLEQLERERLGEALPGK